MKTKYKLVEKTTPTKNYESSVPPPIISTHSPNRKYDFSKKNIIRYTIIFSVAIIIGIISFFGYNEYIYNKVGICFSEGEINLAEYYVNSVSPSYKDNEKIKSLIHSYKNFDENNINDYKRILTILEGYKGFENQNVNYFYNNFYMDVLALVNEANLPEQQNNVPVTGTTNVATSIFQTEASTAEQNTSATEASTEYTTYSYTQTTANSSNSTPIYDIVYYVESGEVYHINRDCRSLARSTNVLSGSIPDNRRPCKICSDG